MKSDLALVEKMATCLGHQDCIYALAAHPYMNRFLTAGADGMVVQWNRLDPEHGEVVAMVGNTVYALQCIANRNQLVVGQNFDGIHLIDLQSRKEIKSLKLTDSPIFDIQMCDDLLLVACGDGAVVAVDIDYWKVVTRFRPTEKSARTVAVNPFWKDFAVGYSDHTIRVFSMEDRREKYVLTGHTNSVFSLAYSPDGTMLLSGGRDAHMLTWAVADNYQLIHDIIPHMYTVNHICFRSDGQYFATCSKDKSIRIWNTATMRPLTTINRANNAGHGTSVNRILWLDNRTLTSVSDDRSVSIWHLNLDA